MSQGQAVSLNCGALSDEDSVDCRILALYFADYPGIRNLLRPVGGKLVFEVRNPLLPLRNLLVCPGVDAFHQGLGSISLIVREFPLGESDLAFRNAMPFGGLHQSALLGGRHRVSGYENLHASSLAGIYPVIIDITLFEILVLSYECFHLYLEPVLADHAHC